METSAAAGIAAVTSQTERTNASPHRRFLEHLLVISQESRQAFVRQWMVEQHIENLERHGRNMRPGFGGLQHMDRTTDGCRKYLRRISVFAVDLEDVSNQFHPIGC